MRPTLQDRRNKNFGISLTSQLHLHRRFAQTSSSKKAMKCQLHSTRELKTMYFYNNAEKHFKNTRARAEHKRKKVCEH